MASTEERREEEQEQERGTRTMRYREALNEALREEMTRDESVFIMGEDIGVFNGAFKVTQGLLEDFGEKRVRDTPIAGFATPVGLRPLAITNPATLSQPQLWIRGEGIPNGSRI